MKNIKYNKEKKEEDRINSRISDKYYVKSKISFRSFLLIVSVLFITFINIGFVFAAADLVVNSFSCTPSETAINSVFSCTAQIKNNGDAAGTVSTATLYPDSNDWLEDSSYAKSSGTSVSPGQTTEVTFTGLRAVKSGNNGFARITLDSVTDNYVSDNNIKVNVIDVAVSVSNTQSSRTMGQTFDTTAQVTAGGNIDVTLTFTVVSGGCSIGNQASQKTISGMQNGNQQSRSWTPVTMGSGSSARNCVFTITAAATGANGIASKTDSSPNTITCTDCPVDSTTTTTTTSGGGGGGGTATKVYTLGELTNNREVEMGNNEQASFNISQVEHKLTVRNHSETTALIEIQSKKQTFTMSVGESINVDLNEEGTADISVKLKSINIITNKVKIIMSPLAGAGASAGAASPNGESAGTAEGGEPMLSPETGALLSGTGWIYWIVGFFVIVALVSLAYYYFVRKKRRQFGIR